MIAPSGSNPTLVAVLAVGGLLFGYGYFTALRHWVLLHGRGSGGGGLRVLAWTLGRLGAAGVFFAWAARWGALPLLASLGGFLLARALVLHVHVHMARREA